MMAAGHRDQHFQPNQFHHQSDNHNNNNHHHHNSVHSSLSLQTRFDGPTSETPGTLNKRSLLHGRSVLSFNSPSPQPNAKRKQNEFPQDRPDVKRTMPSSLAYSARNENARSLNGTRTDKSPMDESRPKNEDIFLNIARDSGRRDSIGRSDFRRSRLGYSSQSLRSPTIDQTPSPDQQHSNADNPLLSQHGSPTTPYSTHTASSAHPLDDPNRLRYSSLGSGARSTVGVPRSRFSRTSPETSPRTPSVADERRSSMHDPRHRHSGLSTIRGSRQPSTSEATERVRADTERSRADGTESTLSTTAPSTVWDELDDLKDRIKKLELTGKLPPSSSAAMYSPSNERPRTANTAITTISSSPKYHRKASVSAADTDSSHSQVQPILQSALAKAKAVLSGEVYTSLEATITDALTLTTALGVNAAPSGSVSVVNGGYSSPERHARRKADSVCRSLTELCLALTDEQLKNHRPSSSREPAAQPQSNGTETNPRMSIPTYQRNLNQEPEGVERRHSTTRISSRLDARRASLVNTSPGNLSEIKQSPTQSPGIPTPTTRLNRASTSLRSRRLTLGEDNTETESPHSRSISRANTDIATPLSTPGIPRQRFSHNRTMSRSISSTQPDQGSLGISPRSPQYQSQVPQPQPQAQPQTPTPRTPTLSSSLSFRRSYMSPATYTPATSRSNIQAGSRRYGLTPGFSSNNIQSDDPPRTPLEPSTRISASNKMATSYTPIQQQRVQTDSFGARRFGLRNRAPTTNNVNLDDSID